MYVRTYVCMYTVRMKREKRRKGFSPSRLIRVDLSTAYVVCNAIYNRVLFFSSLFFSMKIDSSCMWLPAISRNRISRDINERVIYCNIGSISVICDHGCNHDTGATAGARCFSALRVFTKRGFVCNGRKTTTSFSLRTNFWICTYVHYVESP